MHRGVAAAVLSCISSLTYAAAATEPRYVGVTDPEPAPRQIPDRHPLRGYGGGLESLSGMIVASHIHADYGGLELDPAPRSTAPDVLDSARPRLAGDGSLMGAGTRMTLQGPRGLRGGLGLQVFGASGGDLGHDALPGGASADLGRMFVVDVELFFGFGIDAVVFEPYFELRGAADLVFAEVRFTGEPYGLLSTSSYFAASPTLAPRLGAFVPIDQDFYLDVSGQYGFLGIERGGLSVGFGMWDNL